GRRLHPLVRGRRGDALEQGPHVVPGGAEGHGHRGRVDDGEDDPGPHRAPGARQPGHATGRATIGWVANAGGHTTARVPGATHSQMTLDAARLAPASGAPGGARSTPLPLASVPRGSLVRTAAAATAFTPSPLAPGSTWASS